MSTHGYIHLIIGPMFSGKTSLLLSLIERHHRARRSCVIIKHQIDERFASDHIVAHSGATSREIPVYVTGDLAGEATIMRVALCDVIAIDELQFFDAAGAVPAIEQWAARGKIVLCAGLDTDYQREPFPILARAVGMADQVTKLLAICSRCGRDAPFSARICDGAAYANPVGGGEKYAAMCRACHARK